MRVPTYDQIAETVDTHIPTGEDWVRWQLAAQTILHDLARETRTAEHLACALRVKAVAVVAEGGSFLLGWLLDHLADTVDDVNAFDADDDWED